MFTSQAERPGCPQSNPDRWWWSASRSMLHTGPVMLGDRRVVALDGAAHRVAGLGRVIIQRVQEAPGVTVRQLEDAGIVDDLPGLGDRHAEDERADRLADERRSLLEELLQLAGEAKVNPL